MILEAALALEDIGKKLSGLPVDSSFTDLFDELQKTALSLLMKAEEDLLQVTHEELALSGTNATQVREQLSQLKARVLHQEPTVIPEDEELGPRAFREWLQKQGKNMSQLSHAEVIPVIDDIFEEACGKRLDQLDFFDQTTSSQISLSYTLMNWAGYYPDDFTKLKKGKDRFRASGYDLSHVAHAVSCNYLVSSDEKFCQKAKACYAYLGIETEVISPQQLTNRI